MIKKSKSYFIIFLCILLPFVVIGQVEICNNGIDDDNDNLIDLNDDDCFCEVIEPISLIPNPSFEDMECCPDDRSQLDCASNWIQASEPTTDYINTCDWLGWDNFPPPQPFPDGEGIMGFRDGRVRNNNEAEPYWKEYAGACLISPLLKDSLYRFQFDLGFVSPQKSPPIDISFYGTPNCDYLPFGVGNQAFGCPSNSPNWEKLAEATVSGGNGNSWVNVILDIVPNQDMYAIAIGPDCNPISTPISIYYFFDNLLLANLEFFNLKITENLHPCSPDFTLSVPNNPDFEYQWYFNGIALIGEVFSELSQNYGEGNYQVRILDGTVCKVSAEFEYFLPVFEGPVIEYICDGDYYPFGNQEITESGFYTDTFPNVNNCDSIVNLELQVIGQQYDTIDVSIFNGEKFEIANQIFSTNGDYPLILKSSLGCDSLVLLKLTVFNIYIPNIFSPNNDNINDVFEPFSKDGNIRSFSMKIYDRWGNQIHYGKGWNGLEAKSGLYAYIIAFEFSNGTTKVFSGDVTLIR